MTGLVRCGEEARIIDPETGLDGGGRVTCLAWRLEEGICPNDANHHSHHIERLRNRTTCEPGSHLGTCSC